MTRRAVRRLFGNLLAAWLLSVVLAAGSASAQVPVVASWVAPAPVVAYMPAARGVFGLRTVYRPVVAYAAPAVPVAVASPVIAPVTRFYAPRVAVPVTTYRVIAPAPVVVARPMVTTFYAPPVLAPPVVITRRPVVFWP